MIFFSVVASSRNLNYVKYEEDTLDRAKGGEFLARSSRSLSKLAIYHKAIVEQKCSDALH